MKRITQRARLLMLPVAALLIHCSSDAVTTPRTIPSVAGNWTGSGPGSMDLQLTLRQSADGSLSGVAIGPDPFAYRVAGAVDARRRMTLHMVDTVFSNDVPFDFEGTVSADDAHITGSIVVIAFPTNYNLVRAP